MTESEWLTCTDSTLMLEFLRDRASDRKFRLFTVSCCRLFWNCLNVDATRTAIETSEHYADGSATEKSLNQARSAAHSAAWYARYYSQHVSQPGEMEREALRRQYYTERLGHPTEELLWRLYFVAFMTNTNQRLRVDEMPMLRTDPLLARLSPDLFRDIFGNPFRLLTADPSWLTWNEGTVVRLAQHIYDDRAFDHMPILADALEEAGCYNTEILQHCRQVHQHVRGCWLLDLLTGRE
jgi:hypothetical protein